MNETNRIAKQIFNTFIWRIIGFGTLILRVLIIGKNFPIELTGAYDLIMGVVTIGLPTFGLAINSYMIRTVPGKEKDRQLTLFKTILFLEVLTAAIVVTVILATKADSYFCSLVNISDHLNILRLGLFLVIVQIIAMGFLRFYAAIKRIEFSNFLTFFYSNFWIILLALFWATGIEINLSIFFLTWLGGALITIVLGIRRTGISNLIRARFDFSLTSAAYLFSVPLILVSIGARIGDLSSRYILSYYYDAGEVGIYFFAYRPLRMIYDFVTAVGMTVFIPYIIEAHNTRNDEKKSHYLSIMTKYTFIAALPIATGILIGRDDLIILISNPEYAQSAAVIPYIVLMPFLFISMYPAQYILYLENRTKLIGCIFLLSALFNVGLNFLLIPEHTYFGAAVSTVISLSLITIVFNILAYKTLNLRWNFIKPWRILITGLFACGTAHILYGYMDDFSTRLFRLIILGIFILITYTAALFLSKVFEAKELRALKALYKAKS